jgi:hypothetical protein
MKPLCFTHLTWVFMLCWTLRLCWQSLIKAYKGFSISSLIHTYRIISPLHMCILNGIQIWPIDVILHIFQENPRDIPLYLCIWEVQQKCVWTCNMWCTRQEDHNIDKKKDNELNMLCLWKPDHPVFPDRSILKKNIHHTIFHHIKLLT